MRVWVYKLVFKSGRALSDGDHRRLNIVKCANNPQSEMSDQLIKDGIKRTQAMKDDHSLKASDIRRNSIYRHLCAGVNFSCVVDEAELDWVWIKGCVMNISSVAFNHIFTCNHSNKEGHSRQSKNFFFSISYIAESAWSSEPGRRIKNKNKFAFLIIPDLNISGDPVFNITCVEKV